MRKEGETSFVWYSSWQESYDVIKKNAPEFALEVLEAIIKYGLTGEDTELDWRVKSFFCQVKGDIDRAKKRYESAVEGGRKGGLKTIYDRETIEDLLKKGMSPQEIASKLNCSDRRIQQIRRKMMEQNEISENKTGETILQNETK